MYLLISGEVSACSPLLEPESMWHMIRCSPLLCLCLAAQLVACASRPGGESDGGGSDGDGGSHELHGICGLSDAEVACVSDEDCSSPSTCSVIGECEPLLHCESDEDCQAPRVCSDGACVVGCAADLICPAGWFCSHHVCSSVHCSADGGCPAGYELIPGTMGCQPENECGPGLMAGECGLFGTCVECNGDLDCREGLLCSDQGTCQAPCAGHSDCPADSFCEEEVCRLKCTSDWQCRPDAICKDGCWQARCGLDGACPQGWEPIQGSIACRPTSC